MITKKGDTIALIIRDNGRRNQKSYGGLQELKRVFSPITKDFDKFYFFFDDDENIDSIKRQLIDKKIPIKKVSITG